MANPDLHRRARPVWVWAVALVALAVAVPVVALVGHDTPRTDARDRDATTASGPTVDRSGPPRPSAQAEGEAPVPPSRGSARGPVRALFFGDSYFIGGGYTGEDDSMARLASNRLGWVSEINGGGGTGFVTANPEYGLGNYLDQIERGAFDVGRRRWVVIEGGNNDRGVPRAEVVRNARKVVRIAQRTFPRATVVLMGPLDTDGDYADTAPTVRLLRQVARKRGVPFINDMKWLRGHYDLIGPDYVHPYPEGHRILGRKLARALRRL
jgi:lysophospholipase L1-like esterase